MIFSFKDAYRQAVEFLSDGQNTVMYDDQGNPNIMVCIPKIHTVYDKVRKRRYTSSIHRTRKRDI